MAGRALAQELEITLSLFDDEAAISGARNLANKPRAPVAARKDCALISV